MNQVKVPKNGRVFKLKTNGEIQRRPTLVSETTSVEGRYRSTMMSESELFDLKERIYSIALDFRGLNQDIENILAREEYNVGKKVLHNKTSTFKNYFQIIEAELRKAEAGIELMYSLQREQLIDSYSED